MSIAPVTCEVETKAAPARAFELFTSRMTEWWGSRTPAPKPAVAVIVEPFAGGRWFERAADGEETLWGRVVAWEPPERLVLGWQLNGDFVFDPHLLTEVEIRFLKLAQGGTRVTLEHRDLERFGARAGEMAGKVGIGWPRQFGQFVAFSDGLAVREAVR
jgi:uncharacterized protein YndB with AHSA1/START domain